MKTPTRFLTQREAYWFRKGVEESKRHTDMILDQQLERYDLEYMDHLPEGEDDSFEKANTDAESKIRQASNKIGSKGTER